MEAWLESHSLFLPLFFAGLWVFVSKVSSVLGGWNSLAKKYRSVAPFDGMTWRGQSAKIGMANYGGIMTFGASHDMLFMSVIFVFRVGHPNLTIPLSDVTGRFHKGWVFKYVDLSFATVPGVTVRTYKKLADKIVAETRGNWTYAQV